MRRHAMKKHPQQWKSINEKALNQNSLFRYFKNPNGVEKYKINSEKRKQLNRKLIAFISKDIRPLSITQGNGFKEFINELDPRYTLPSVPTIRDKLLPRLYEQNMDKLQQELNETKFISLTTDGWTSTAADKYHAFTVHYINWSEKEPVLKSKILECAPFEADKGDAIELEKELQRVAIKYKIKDKLVLTCGDNAKDQQKALALFGVPKIGCAAHKINLVAKRGLKIEPIKNLISKLANIARKTKVSPGAKKVLLKYIKKVGIRGKSF